MAEPTWSAGVGQSAAQDFVAFAVTDEPWSLAVDALVVSVGYTFGGLGEAVAARFPDAPWPDGFEAVTVEEPGLVRLRDRKSTDGSGPWLVILAKPHTDDGVPTIQTIENATSSAVRVAREAGADSIAIPMLATGDLGVDIRSVAAIAAPAALRTAESVGMARVVFLSRTEEQFLIVQAGVRGRLPLPRRLRSAWGAQTEFDLAGGVSTDLVDPNVGIPLSKDQLGVAPYVSMLATMIADRKTPTPLSVGIFGEWGSGKSYFMGLLRKAIDELARSGEPTYCPEIAQIGFNAWHYADSNLWASLGDEIFRQLAEPECQPGDRRRQLRAELGRRLGRRQELDAETEQARETVVALQAQVDAATEDRWDRAAKLITALRGSPEFARHLDSLWRKLGITDLVDQSKLLADELNGSLSDADALRRVAADRTGRWIVPVAAMALIACAVVAAFVPPIRTWLPAASAALTVAFATGVSLLARARSGVRALRTLSEQMRSSVNRAAPGDMMTAAAAFDALRAAESQQRVAEAQLQDVVSHIGALGRQLSELAPGRRLYSFLASKVDDKSYQRNLGLISMIRKDFEQLVRLMADWRDHPDDDEAHRPIDRIVLYIDDLDRCSPQQVVDVLQAVHLLLALDLFIVVIGVDPRWLLRSLRSHYDTILDGADAIDADPWRMVPEDYLDKIINIPVVLPGMPTGSLNRLLLAIAGERDDTHDGGGFSIADWQAPDGNPAPVTGYDIGIEPGSEIDAHDDTTSATREPPRRLTGPELYLLSTLDVLVETPRQAKRLFNLYRMIRATRDLSDASQFLGEDGEPGEYQAVVVLLGLIATRNPLLSPLLDAVPGPGDDVAGGLLHRQADTGWHRFVADILPTDGHNSIVGRVAAESIAGWTQLSSALVQVSAAITLRDVSVFQQWVPRIRRFSYNLVT